MVESQATLQLTTPVANGICLSQKPVGGGVQELTLNGSLVSGGSATFDVARRVVIASTSGSDSTLIFIITGTDRNGTTLTESMNLGVSDYDFKKVSSIKISGNPVGNITAGTNQQASSNWTPLDVFQTPFNVSVSACVSSDFVGTYTVEQTPLNTSLPEYYNTAAQFVIGGDNSNLVSATNTQTGLFIGPTRAIRLTFNTYTSGSVTFFVKQGN